jgi:NADH dehydrogenase FAD-containing subunit
MCQAFPPHVCCGNPYLYARMEIGFEQAAQPTLTAVERRNLLNFCIVGGGPTGIEFAAELHDLISTDIGRYYPLLARLPRITVYEVSDTILGNFDEELRDYAAKRFAVSLSFSLFPSDIV